MYQIKTTSSFDDDFRKLDSSIARRLIKKIEWLAKNPEVLRSLIKYMPEGLEGLRKYRVGDWRILFWTDCQKKELTLYGVEHRKTIYKKLKKR